MPVGSYDIHVRACCLVSIPYPCHTLTKRGHFKGKNYTVVFKKEGYKDHEMAIKRGPDGWFIFGNLLFGGLVGWLIVDPITGAMWTLPKEITSTLDSSAESQLDQASFTVATIDDVPKAHRDKWKRSKR